MTTKLQANANTPPAPTQMASHSINPGSPLAKEQHPRKGRPRPPRSPEASSTPFVIRSQRIQSFGLPLLSHHELTAQLVRHYGSLFLRREDAVKALMESREVLEACVREGWLRPHTSENRMTSYSIADIAACLLRLESEGRPSSGAGSGNSQPSDPDPVSVADQPASDPAATPTISEPAP
ncbi:MAG: hypothetical protein ABMA26_22780 [Limisphaerales bacterium]